MATNQNDQPIPHVEPTSGPEKMRPQAVAGFLGVPVSTVYSWVRRKQIPHIRLGKTLILFDRKEILRWLDSRTVHSK